MNNYLTNPSIPLHQQTLLGVTIPPQTKEEQNEKDWELTEAPDRYDIGNQILEAEVTPEGDSVYEENKARINAATAKNAATIRKLKQDQADRFRAEYPEYAQPEPVRSESYNKIRRIVG